VNYSEKLKDPRWQRKRLEIFQRDNFICQDCGDNTNTLHVHHLKYEKKDPWDYDNNDLITLCETCHKDREDKKELVKLIGLKLSPPEIYNLKRALEFYESKTDDKIYRNEIEIIFWILQSKGFRTYIINKTCDYLESERPDLKHLIKRIMEI
jgi:hypothetical protein